MADQGNDIPRDPFVTKDLVQHLLKHGADLPLSYPNADIQGLLGNLRSGFLLLDQEIANLGTVTVGDHYPVAGTDQWRELPASQLHIEHLLRNIAVVTL